MTTISELSTATRFLIARVTDLAIDVSLAGKYEAQTTFSPGAWGYSVIVWPAGNRNERPVYHHTAFLAAPAQDTALDAAEDTLGEMIETLEGLLAESKLEVKPS